MTAPSATPRAVPFYCPFCGEQDLRPVGDTGYHCAVCDRTWELTLLSIGAGSREPSTSGEEPRP